MWKEEANRESVDASKGGREGATNLDLPESLLDVSINEVEMFFDVDCEVEVAGLA